MHIRDIVSSSAPLSYHPNSHHNTRMDRNSQFSCKKDFKHVFKMHVFPSKCFIWYTSRSNAAALNNTVVLFQHQTSLGCSLVSMPSNHATLCHLLFHFRIACIQPWLGKSKSSTSAMQSSQLGAGCTTKRSKELYTDYFINKTFL